MEGNRMGGHTETSKNDTVLLVLPTDLTNKGLI